jgi:hypothetical protein
MTDQHTETASDRFPLAVLFHVGLLNLDAHNPNRWRYSIEVINAFIISALI